MQTVIRETFIKDIPGDFASKFNKWSYQFQHRLTNNPLFELPRLIELSRNFSGKQYYDAGEAKPHDRWDQMPSRNLSVEEVLRQIESAKAWFFIRIIDEDAEYAAVLNECLTEAEDLAGYKFREGMKQQEMIVFVTSPKRVTTYHIDRECSFLMQVRGSKTIHIFDGNDREVLPEQEIEHFWTIDHNAPKYRKELQHRATSYALTPGTAVHIPVNFPHWLENDDNVSISVNINVQFAESKLANVYRANHFLRRLGLNPRPPRQSPLVDACKSMAMSPVLAGKRLASRG